MLSGISRRRSLFLGLHFLASRSKLIQPLFQGVLSVDFTHEYANGFGVLGMVYEGNSIPYC